MSRNILFCSAGVILGFVIGFFVANSLSRPAPFAPVAAEGVAGDGTARPLDPSQTDGELPPNHPDIGDAAGKGSPASTSPQAQAAMDKADRNPGDFDAQKEAAAVFYILQDFDKSTLYLDRALKLRPKDFDALVAMGNAKYDGGDFVAAASFYERALAVNPSDPDVRTDYGNTFFRRSPPDYDRAIAEYRKSVAAAPAHENSWKNIAAAAMQKNDKQTAQEAVEKLAAINPQNPALESLRAGIARLP